MSEEEATAPGPRALPSTGPDASSRPVPVDPATVLLAVDRVGAEVTALGRALAAVPEEMAARLDVDGASAAVGVRVGALGSAIDQLRLSLLAALDRTVDRMDAPVWLAGLQVGVAELAPIASGQAELRAALAAADPAAGVARLEQAIADADPTARLTRLEQAIADADPTARLTRLEEAVAQLADGVRAGAAIADALDHHGDRLAAIEHAANRVAGDAHVLLDRVASMPDRLNAIAVQVDRITPLARAGDQAGSLFDQLERVGTGMDEMVTLLRDRAGHRDGAEDDEERFEGIIDVLAGVARRQDELSAVAAEAFGQARGPRAIDAVFERMEQRERSLAARLDRIEAELRRGAGAAPAASSAEALPKAGQETAKALDGVVAMVEQQERVLASRLGQLEAEVRKALASEERGGDVDRRLAAVLERMDRQERTLASQLSWVGERLAEVAAHLLPDDEAAARAHEGEADLESALHHLAGLAQRLDLRLAGVEAALEQGAARLHAAEHRSTAAAQRRRSTSAELAALRLAELRAERSAVQARLQEERLLAAGASDEGGTGRATEGHAPSSDA